EVDEAVERLLADVTDDDLQRLDHQVQARINRQFNGLRHACQSSAALMKNLETVLRQEAEALADDRLAGSSVVGMFFQRYPREEEAQAALAEAFDQAVPELAVRRLARAAERNVLAVPPGPLADRLHEQARQALPDVAFTVVPSHDDVVFYREMVNLPL